jgi:deoxyribodipyrimidine photolyase
VRQLTDTSGFAFTPHHSDIHPGDMPSLGQLGFSDDALRRANADGAAAGARLQGGERHALEGMQVASDARMSTTMIISMQCKAQQQTVCHSCQTPRQQAFLRELRPSSKKTVASSSAFASQVSPWLAVGCLSPRTLYHSLRQQLAATSAGHAAAAPRRGIARGGQDADGLSWLLFELMWRDFFKMINMRLSPPACTPATAGSATAVSPMIAMA